VSRYLAVNSSPLILLGRISRLDLLPALALFLLPLPFPLTGEPFGLSPRG
jgi:hypothetical protein